MTLHKPQWFRSPRKWVAGLLLLLCASGAALAAFAWKRCDDTSAATIPTPRPLPKNPASRPVAKEEPKQRLSRYSLPVNALAFSPDGMRLATAALNTRPPCRGEVRIWDLVTGREECGCRDFPRTVFSLAFSPDAKTLASGGEGYLSRPGDVSSVTSEVKLWNLDAGAKPALWQKTAQNIVAVAFSPQGDRLAAGGDKGRLTLYNRATGEPERTLRADAALTWFTNVAFSADGKKIAWGGVASSGGPTARPRSILQVWDAASGKLLATLHPPESPLNTPNTKNVLFLPGGDKVVSSSVQTIYIWDVNSGQIEASLSGHQGIIDALAISPDGHLLASSDGYACIKLWEVSTRREKTTLRQPTIIVQGSRSPQQGLKEGATVALAFDPDGEILASSTLYRSGSDQPGVVQLWDLVSLKEIALPK